MAERKRKVRTHVLTAFAESAYGPGWANSPVWVIVRDDDGTIRKECIQPADQSAEMRTLYAVSQAAHVAMSGAVARCLSDLAQRNYTPAGIKRAKIAQLYPNGDSRKGKVKRG